jgi:tetratricopeptide (TPR) repeat protein
MDFLKKLFGTKLDEKSIETKVIYKSEIPDFIDSANKIYNKEYDSAIADLSDQLKKVPPVDFKNLSMIHINLMQSYYKSRDTNPNNFDLSTHHAKEALKYGHNTGLASFRLITNLEKQKKLKQAIEVCEIVTDKNYFFSIHGYKQKPEFVEKLKKLKLKLEKIGDNCDVKLFTEGERAMVFKNSRKNE